MKQPLISVCVLTYNHEKYIQQSLESIFSQTVIGECEVIIGEDNSSDGTRDIVQRYAQRPNVTLLLTDDDSRKIYYNGRKTGRRNFFDCLGLARGRYVAVLEGDDYWIDPEKLAKQVALLERNTTCTLCFHDNYREFEDGTRINYDNFKPSLAMRDEHIVLRHVVPHTSTVLFRNVFDGNWPEVMVKAAYGDWPLFLYALGRGTSCYLTEKMSVYRIHSQGYWTGRAVASYQTPLDHVYVFRHAETLLNDRYHDFQSGIRQCVWRLKWRAMRHALRAKAFGQLWKALNA